MPFQSTHPVRGATVNWYDDYHDVVISIHAPREGCDAQMVENGATVKISIHAPREGCDVVTVISILV